MVDCLNELREGCLEAYTGIVQGLKSDENKSSRKYDTWHTFRIAIFYSLLISFLS